LRTFAVARAKNFCLYFSREQHFVSMNQTNAVRPAAIAVEDTRVLGVALVSVILLSLALILSPGAAWLHVT